MHISDLLTNNPVVPLIQADDPIVAVKTAKALSEGGLSVVEVVFRTERALECLQAVADQVPEVIAGAGTVLNASQAIEALDHGAKFIISPGMDQGTVCAAQERDVPIFPGVLTPSEAQFAYNLGLDTVKFFPAELGALKALASVFRTLKFMPTGGVNASNLAAFLSVPAVLACGGSWLTPKDKIQSGDYATVTALAREALTIAHSVRGNTYE